jgi:transposase
MNGARFVYDFLTDAGWLMVMADALRVKGIAPLAAKTDRIDSRVLAELSRLDLVPAVWIPPFEVRQDRERARFRIGLVHQRTSLKNRIHAILIAQGRPCPVSDLFGRTGRRILAQAGFDEPWASHVEVMLELIDELDSQIGSIETELRSAGPANRYVALLKTIPGIGDILAFTIAAELGDISRFPTASKLVGYTGLSPRVNQSGTRDRRGPLARNGPKHLRWALIEAAVHACRYEPYAGRYQKTKQRFGPLKGTQVARVELARDLTKTIWWMLTRDEQFNPRGPTHTLAA